MSLEHIFYSLKQSNIQIFIDAPVLKTTNAKPKVFTDQMTLPPPSLPGWRPGCRPVPPTPHSP